MSINWGQSRRRAGRAGRGTEPARGRSSVPHGRRAAPGPETSGKESGTVPAVAWKRNALQCPSRRTRAASGPSSGKEMGGQSWTAGKCSPARCPGVWEGGGWVQTIQSVRASLGWLKCTIARAGAGCRGSGAQCRLQSRPDPHAAGELHGSGPPERLLAATLTSGSGFPHQQVRFECGIYPVISRLWSLLGKGH